MTNNVFYLKTRHDMWHDIADGKKNFDVRKDKNFQVGDILIFQLYTHGVIVEGKMNLARTITYILPGGQFGIEEGYCVLGIS